MSSMGKTRIRQLAQAHPLLKELDAARFERFFQGTTARAIRPGHLVQASGSCQDTVCLLLEGSVKACHQAVKGRKMQVAFYSAPGIFGDIAVLLGLPTLEEITAIDATQLLEVSAHNFWTLLNIQPSCTHAMLLDLARRVYAASEAHRALGFGSISARLASLLLDYGDLSLGGAEKSAEKWVLEAKLTQQSLADDLGVSRTALVQALDVLRTDGLVEKSNGRYVVKNTHALKTRYSRLRGSHHRLALNPKNGCIASQPPFMASPKGSTLVRVCMPLPVIEAGQAPFYMAQHLGAYGEEGLNLRFSSGRGPVEAVACGEVDFGVVGGPEAVVMARGRGIPLQAIAVLHRNSNFTCLLTLPSSKITDLNSLQGARIGLFYDHISTEVLRILLQSQNITYTEKNVGYDYTGLLAGTLQAQWAFTVTAGLNLPAQGIEVNTISPASYGLSTHGYTLFASTQTLQRRPSMVTGFLRATLKGVVTCRRNPEAANAIMLKHDPCINESLNLTRLKAYNRVTNDSDEFPPGYLDHQMFQEAYTNLAAQQLIQQPFPISEVFTTRFVNQLPRASLEN